MKCLLLRYLKYVIFPKVMVMPRPRLLNFPFASVPITTPLKAPMLTGGNFTAVTNDFYKTVKKFRSVQYKLKSISCYISLTVLFTK